MSGRPDAILIAGPTASGKSLVALALAEAIGGVIINADSMQVYAEPRILTARPSDEEMSRAPHLLYGHVSVREAYSAGRYQADASRALADVREDGRTPIFVGGTGLYFSVLTNGIAEIPSIAAEVRARVSEHRDTIGAEAFHTELSARDPESAARLRPSDTQRVGRAYEVFEATGEPLSYWQKQKARPVLAGVTLARFVFAPPREELYSKIEARFDRMIEHGAVEEAATLAKLDLSTTAAKVLGLRELVAVSEGALSLDDAKAAAKQATRNYAKRQLTWFRNRMTDWIFIRPPPSADSAAMLVAQLGRC